MCMRCPDATYRPWPSGPPGPGNYGRQPNYGEGDFGPMPKGRGPFGLWINRDVTWTQGRRRDRGRAIGGLLTPLIRLPHRHPQ